MKNKTVGNEKRTARKFWDWVLDYYRLEYPVHFVRSKIIVFRRKVSSLICKTLIIIHNTRATSSMEHRQHAPTLFRWTLNKRLLHMNIALSYAVYCCINLPGTNCQNDPPGSREPRERAFGAGLIIKPCRSSSLLLWKHLDVSVSVLIFFAVETHRIWY